MASKESSIIEEFIQQLPDLTAIRIKPALYFKLVQESFTPPYGFMTPDDVLRQTTACQARGFVIYDRFTDHSVMLEMEPFVMAWLDNEFACC